MMLLQATLNVISDIDPSWFIIENPVGKMRKMPMMESLFRQTVTYCQYGEKRMKPTDLWGRFPKGLVLKPLCKKGAPCHVAAPRGSSSGTQGMTSAQAARVPDALALAVCLAAERCLAKKPV